MLSPEELAALNARVGANADKLIGATQRKLYTFSGAGKGRKPLSFQNTLQGALQAVVYEDDEKWPLWVDDVLSGVARLDWGGGQNSTRPLSKKKIAQCLAQLETIDASSVSHLLLLEQRQAQRYVKACELSHKYLVDGANNPEIRCLHYPVTFIYPRSGVVPDLKITDTEE